MGRVASFKMCALGVDHAVTCHLVMSSLGPQYHNINTLDYPLACHFVVPCDRAFAHAVADDTIHI
jgi:hypothetical protein